MSIAFQIDNRARDGWFVKTSRFTLRLFNDQLLSARLPIKYRLAWVLTCISLPCRHRRPILHWKSEEGEKTDSGLSSSEARSLSVLTQMEESREDLSFVIVNGSHSSFTLALQGL